MFRHLTVGSTHRIDKKGHLLSLRYFYDSVENKRNFFPGSENQSDHGYTHTHIRVQIHQSQAINIPN